MNSELQTICYVVTLSLLCMHNFHVVFNHFPTYISCVWSHHNQLFTVHHSVHYNLVSLIFGTPIPKHFNEVFFTLVSLIFLGYIPSSVHFEFCFFVDCFTIPTCLLASVASPPSHVNGPIFHVCRQGIIACNAL